MKKWKSLQTRSISAVVFVIIMLAGLLNGQWIYTLLWLFIGGYSAFELYRLLVPNTEVAVSKGEYRFFSFACILTACLPILGVFVFLKGIVGNPLYFMAFTIVLFTLLLLLSLWSNAAHTFHRLGVAALAQLYIGWPLALIVFLGLNSNLSYLPALSILFLTWINDAGAYFVGKQLGKTAFWPKHSPNKTWEGTLGGLFFCALAGLAVAQWFWLDLSWQQGLLLALVVGITGSLGDLAESMLKRQTGAKDAGSIMPGHGGLLDRFDAFLVCVPFVFVLLLFMGKV